MKMHLYDMLVRGCLIVGLGVAVGLGASHFLLWSANDASADIYWQDASVSNESFFRTLSTVAERVVFGGPVSINSENGYYVVMEASQDATTLLEQLKGRFSEMSADDIRIGQGAEGGFFTARDGDRMCATMLIQDFNRGRTLLFSIIAPVRLFQRPADSRMDCEGADPVAELRPPGSTRVFCFETPALSFGAYKCMDNSLASFYESALSGGEARGVSIMAFADARLPHDGNLMFFERGIQKGFVAYQSSPDEGGSYAIVCAQMQ